MKLSRILILFVLLCMLSTGALARTPEDAENTVAFIQAIPVFDSKYKESGLIENGTIRIKYGGYSYGVGTGFAVGTDENNVEYFVTNYHVVDVKEKVDLIYLCYDAATGQPLLDEFGNHQEAGLSVPITGMDYYVVFESEQNRVKATHVATSDRADLAVLKLDKPTNKRKPSILRPYETLEKQDVYPLGFPGVVTDLIRTNDDGKQHVQSTKGRINSFYTHEETGEGDQFLMDAPITHGNSGGPVVDENGHVVGVSVSGHGQYINLNVAISINEVVRMLDSKGIPYLTIDDVDNSDNDGKDGGGKDNGGKIDDGKDDESFDPKTIATIGSGFLVGLTAYILRRKKKSNPVIVDSDKPDDGPVDPSNKKDRMLICEAGALQGQRFELSKTTTIGRDPSCGIALPDQTRGVSSKHCSITCSDGVVTVTDLGSAHGTWIDNVKLVPGQGVVMHRGHHLYLGSKQQAFILRSSAKAGQDIPISKPVATRSLTCDAGALQGQRFPLLERTTIGREPSCTIVLPEQTRGVSGKHCSISCVNGIVTVTDMGSKNGTWIDNVKLVPGQSVVMHRGHTLYLGSKEQAFTLHS